MTGTGRTRPGAGLVVGWTLLAWLAGFGAVPFISVGALALSEAVGLSEAVLGTFGLSLTSALVTWVAGRPGPSRRTQLLVGATFLPVVQGLNVLAFGALLPLGVVAAQTLVGVVGAGLTVLLAVRRQQRLARWGR